ncbi:hypothetical protein [Gemmata sp.]|uniref:hypothetical protein n=1 Tax=Gemmata sp. TaxID=1914242 RepID=UPI003F715E40
MSADLRTAAAAALGVPPDAPPAAAVGAFLVSLPGDEFVPSPERVAAVNALALAAAPVDPDTDLGPAAAVGDFARRFWSLPPAERREEWAALGAGVPPGPLTERLAALRAGLDVTAEPVPDAAAEEVAGVARELFVLPPRARAVRRNEWLVANAPRHGELVRGAAALGHMAPASARLDPQLMRRLSPGFDAAGFAAAASEGTLESFAPRDPVEASRAWYADDGPTEEMVRAASASRRAAAPAAAAGSGCGGPWIAVVIVVTILRGLMSLSSNRAPDPAPVTLPPGGSYRPAPPPEYKPRPGGTRTPSDGAFFTVTEIANYRSYEQLPRRDPPPRYDDWVRCGRPALAGWHEPRWGPLDGTAPPATKR